MRARSSFILHPSSLRGGFTLTEVLIVIGIIVLILVMAVPALNVITGSRSIDGAENNISAMLGRARADAIGVQTVQGVFFFVDPATETVTLAQVREVDRASSGRDVFLDLVPDRDFLVLPKGVTAQFIDNAALTGSTRDDDGYLGFNQNVGTFDGTGATTDAGYDTTLQYGGVILFDGKGRLASDTYAFRGSKVTPAGATVPTDLMNLLMTGKIGTVSTSTDDLTPMSSTGLLQSQIGFILMDREAFLNNGDLSDVQVATAGTYATSERGEESWIDQNSTPLMINRYNGTLLRGE